MGQVYMVLNTGIGFGERFFANSSFLKKLFWAIFILSNKYFILNYGINLIGNLFD